MQWPLSLHLLQVNSLGQTPLHVAATAEIVQILLDAGASVLEDNAGKTWMDLAIKRFQSGNLDHNEIAKRKRIAHDLPRRRAPLSDVNLVGISSFLLFQSLAMATKPSSVSGEPWPDSLAQRRQCGDRTGSTGHRRLPHHPG